MNKSYGQKRNFGVTPEPSWSVKDTGKSGAPLAFVVQKHESRRLHFDLRLELDGVLKSWAVPHGISMDPSVKRLAVMVEDHPLDYGSFEGVIPEGEYGAGKVTVWDKGTYSPERDGLRYFNDREAAQKLVRDGLEKGEVKIFLSGNSLRGSFVLVRLKNGENNWLIIKHRDEYSDASTPMPVGPATIKSDESGKGSREAVTMVTTFDPATVSGAKTAPFPEHLSPMLAFPAKKVFSDSGWIYEPKLDGFRTLAFVRDGKVKLLSRNGVDSTTRFQFIAQNDALKSKHDFIIDGEIVALDENGRPCFQCLQDYIDRPSGNSTAVSRLFYYVFDVVYLDGYDLSGVSLTDRKQLLAQLIPESGPVQRVNIFEEDGELVYQTALSHGFEGIMAKRLGSLYEAGRRSGAWLKIKAVQTDDFVIGGYETGRGSRSDSIGSLLLGEYEDGKLIYRGQTGSGFDDKTLLDLKSRLDRLKAGTSPFDQGPKLAGRITWVTPDLVAEVKYAERTRDGRLRVPIFLRLREDKTASEVHTQVSHVIIPSEGNMPGGTLTGSIVSRLEQGPEEITLDIDGHRIKLTNLIKVYWPESDCGRAVTKRDLLIYLTKASPFILPHLKNRPVTLNRYPGGIEGEHFYQRHWHIPLPEFVETVELPEEREKEPELFILCNNLATLLWLGQSGNLEIHAWFSRASDGEYPVPGSGAGTGNIVNLPDFIIFDLDPYIYSGREAAGAEPELNKEGFSLTVRAAKWLKETLDSLSLPAFVKTSGKTGLHVYVPVIRNLDYDAIRAVARTIATHLLGEHPEELTTEWPIARRGGKVFIDYKQNMYSRTLASVYSPRASTCATVSMGLRWEQLESIYPTDFTVLNAARSLAENGDPWSDMLSRRVNLESVLKL